MSEFIIDTPYHKRYWLGDGLHVYNSRIYGDTEHASVFLGDSLKCVSDKHFDLNTPDWREVSNAWQQSMHRLYSRTVYIRLSTSGGGSFEFWMEGRDFNDPRDSQREAVAHAAWRAMFNVDARREKNNVAVMLKGVCDKIGVEAAKKAFTKAIKYERIG